LIATSRYSLGPLNRYSFSKKLLAIELIHGIISISVVIKFNKAIAILDENITETTVAFEKFLKVSFLGAVWKPTDIDPCPYHTEGLLKT